MSIESNTFNKSRTKRQYSYAGEPEAERVLDWLNGEHDTERVRRVLLTCQLLEKEIRAGGGYETTNTLEGWLEMKRNYRESKRAAALRHWLNDQLKQLKLVPFIPLENGEYGLIYRSVGKFKRGEDRAILPCVVLWAMGLASRIRHCKQCQKWFFARVERKQYCSTACLQKAFTQREEFKAKRAKYMKQHRKDLKQIKWQYK